MAIGIYKFTSPDGFIYVGQAKNIQNRFNEHKWGAKFANDRFKSKVDEFGFDSFLFEILCECSIEDLNEMERFYQDMFDVCGEKGLNCRLTPASGKPIYIRPETLEKMGVPKRGRKFSAEHKARIGESKVGKKRDPEMMRRIIENRKPVVWSEERSRIQSEKMKGHTFNRGKVRTEEAKAKNRIHLDKFRFGANNHGAKLILDTAIGVYFDTLKDAAIAHNIKPVTLVAMMKGRNRNRTNLIYA